MRLRWPIAFVIALGVVHCGSSHDDPPPAAANVVYGNETTDEGLDAFDGAAATTDAAKAPALTAPLAGSKVPATATPIAFTWKGTPTGFVLRARPRYAGASPFGPMRAAHAHGDPMNGKAYLLTLKSGGAVVLRAFTKETTFTPDADAWTKLTAAKTIEATLASASFDNNNIVPGTGPFVAPPVSFTIE